jgi:hypothetical protein
MKRFDDSTGQALGLRIIVKVLRTALRGMPGGSFVVSDNGI